MNGKLNTENYQYQLNQTYRDDALRTAEAQRLAQIAAEPKTRRSLFAGLRRWFQRPAQPNSSHRIRILRRAPHLTIAAIFVIATLLATAAPSYAQTSASIDPGATEAYHPGLVHYRVGIFYQVRGDHERAVAEFTQTLNGLPGFGYAYAARGDSYAALDDYQLAIADYDQAIAIYPDFVSTLYTRGRVYLALGETERAAADFANAVGQMPEYALPHFGLGDVAFERGEYGEALVEYQQYLFLVDEMPDALVIERIDTLKTMAAGTL